MSTAEAEVPTEVQEFAGDPPVAEAEKQAVDALFKWSQWLHVGDGAATCEHGIDGSCKDHSHFHAWCRLPNAWQVRDITDKARAAQARHSKLLRDPDSDLAIVLESDLEELHSTPKEILVEEVIDRSFPDDYSLAVRTVDAMVDEDWEPDEDQEESDRPLRFQHIDQDREEWERLQSVSEEKRPADYAVIERNIADYGRAIEAEMDRLQAPRRTELMESDTEELVATIRKERIEHRATEVYLHWFNTWQWFVCTFKPRRTGTPNERVWGDINQMKQEAPPEVVQALRELFDGLESNLAASRRGKGF